LKYIIVNQEGLPCAVMFSEAIQHSTEAAGREVMSAGFCNLQGEVWGHSESLGVHSQPQDTKHIRLTMEMSMNPKPAAR